MLSIFLVSRSLINASKISKVQEDYRSYNNAIQIFYNTYGCFPGDCKTAQITDVIGAGLTSNCTAVGVTATYYEGQGISPCSNISGPTTLTLNNNIIDSMVKRSCMFYSLQLTGLISGAVNPTYNTVANLADSVAGKNIPIAKFSSQSAWDFTTFYFQGCNGSIGSNMSDVVTIEGITSSWQGGYGFVLRDANTVANNNQYGLYATWNVISFPALSGPGISSKLSSRLDTKYDDGMPLQGNIRSAKNNIVGNCFSGALNASVVTATYLDTNSPGNGCFLAYFVPQLL